MNNTNADCERTRVLLSGRHSPPATKTDVQIIKERERWRGFEEVRFDEFLCHCFFFHINTVILGGNG